MATHTILDTAFIIGAPWFEVIGTQYTATATEVVILDNLAFETRLSGTFIVNADGVVTGGTITGMKHTATGNGTVYETVTGMSLGATLFLNQPDPAAKMSYVLFGSDTLTGSANGDILRGFAGSDAMAGGGGSDIYYVDQAGDTVIEAAASGTDVVYTALTNYTLSANVEELHFTGSAKFTGTGNSGDNLLYGNIGNDTLYGGGGIDYLDGGLGNDTLEGGAGDDFYVVDAVLDTVIDSGGTHDTVITTLTTYTLGLDIERLVHAGSGPSTGTGNGLNNELLGGDGNDTLYGLGGSDLMGSTTVGGEDKLVGGAENDNYFVNSLGDTTIEIASGGNHDGVYASTGKWTLAANMEELYNYGSGNFSGTGNGLDNFMTGAGQVDVLHGLGGNDQMLPVGGNDKLFGEAGDDFLEAGDGTDLLNGGAGADTLDGGDGVDTADYLESIGGVKINLATGTASGGDAAGDVLVSIESVRGSAFGDVLLGNADANVLRGGDGNDQLTGGTLDKLFGGAGNDVFILGAGMAAVDDGAGTDAIQTTISRSLGSYGSIENLVLLGNDAIDGVGNGLDNGIRGNNAANVIIGGGGIDTLRGNGGADRFVFNTAVESGPGSLADSIVDFKDSGADVIDLRPLSGGVLGYLGSGAFTGIDQVRVTAVGSDLIVAVNLDGNFGTSELEIRLTGTDLAAISAGDFLL